MDDHTSSGVPHPSELDTGRRRRRRWIAIGAVFVAIGVLTPLLAFGLSRDPTLIRSPLLGKAAPAFSLRTLDGSQTVSLADLRGQVVVINFWASWCTECRVEHGALDKRTVFIGDDDLTALALARYAQVPSTRAVGFFTGSASPPVARKSPAASDQLNTFLLSRDQVGA